MQGLLRLQDDLPFPDLGWLPLELKVFSCNFVASQCVTTIADVGTRNEFGSKPCLKIHLLEGFHFAK